MRTGAGLDSKNPSRVDQPGTADTLRVFGSDQVVGDHCQIDAPCRQRRNEALDERGLSRSDRATDTDARGVTHRSMYFLESGTTAAGGHMSKRPSACTSKVWGS